MPKMRTTSVWFVLALAGSGLWVGSGLPAVARSAPEVEIDDPQVPFSDDELFRFFLKQIEREEEQTLTQEDLDKLDLVALSQATPFRALPPDLQAKSRRLLRQGIDRSMWYEAMARALERLADQPRTAARDRVLGTGANSLAMHYWSVGIREAKPEYSHRARQLFRFGIEHARYHPARIEAGRMYGQLSITAHGAGSEQSIFGFRAAEESFHAMPEGNQKEFLRRLYVNTASHLFSALFISEDFERAYETGRQILSDERNHAHFSSRDNLASISISTATAAIRADDADAATAAVAEAIRFVDALAADPTAETLYDPQQVRETLLKQLERMPAKKNEKFG